MKLKNQSPENHENPFVYIAISFKANFTIICTCINEVLGLQSLLRYQAEIFLSPQTH